MKDRTNIRTPLSNTKQFTTCKEAGRRLYAELNGKIKLTGVGVSIGKKTKRPAIHLMLLNKADLDKVPTEYEGYEVDAIATGIITAY